jgi:hypothetical protein
LALTSAGAAHAQSSALVTNAHLCAVGAVAFDGTSTTFTELPAVGATTVAGAVLTRTTQSAFGLKTRVCASDADARVSTGDSVTMRPAQVANACIKIKVRVAKFVKMQMRHHQVSIAL